MTGSTALGEFLKARRGQLQPSDVGLVGGGRRRVAGLRREELAAVAGISADYYLRIEQGRIGNPSAQVLDALARALRLDAVSTTHLHALATGADFATDVHPENLKPGTAELVDQLAVPALVVGRYLDCLASNTLARALSPNFSPGHNLLRQMLLDPAERRLHIDWDDAVAGLVGGLRQVAGVAADPQLRQLVDELTRRSEHFAQVWARADVGFRSAGESRLRHPDVGELRLRRQRFDIPDSGGQHMHVYYVTPGTDTAERMRRLHGGLSSLPCQDA